MMLLHNKIFHEIFFQVVGRERFVKYKCLIQNFLQHFEDSRTFGFYQMTPINMLASTKVLSKLGIFMQDLLTSSILIL